MAIGISIGIGAGGSGGGNALSASARQFLNNVSPGGIIAGLSHPYGGGETYTVIGTAPGQLALSGSNIVAGSTAAVANTDYTITIRVAKAGRAIEEPLVFRALAAPIVLNPLSLSSTSATVGTAKTINITGTTPNSTLTGIVPDGMVLNSSARTISGTPSLAGAYNFGITESLDGVSRTTQVTITVAGQPLNSLTLNNVAYRNTMRAGDVVADIVGITAGSTLELIGGDGSLAISGNKLIVGANRAPDAYDSVSYGSPAVPYTTPASETGAFSIIENKSGITAKTDFGSITVTGKFFPVAGQSTSAYLRTQWTSGDTATRFETASFEQCIMISYFRPDATIGATAPLFGTRGSSGTEVTPAIRIASDQKVYARAQGTAYQIEFPKVEVGKWASLAAQISPGASGQFNTVGKRFRGTLNGLPPNVIPASATTSAITADRFHAVETASGTTGAKQSHMFNWMWYGSNAECPPINWADPRNQAAILPENMNATTGVVTLYDDSGNSVVLTPKLFYHGKATDYDQTGLANRGTASVVGNLSKINTSAHYHPGSTTDSFIVVGDPTVVQRTSFSQDGTTMDFGTTAKDGGQFWNGDWWIDNSANSAFTTLPATTQGARSVVGGGTRPTEWYHGAMKNPGNNADTQAYPTPPKPWPLAGWEGRDGNGDGSRQGFDECGIDNPSYTHALNAAVGSRTDNNCTIVKIASQLNVPTDGQYLAKGQAAYTLARPPLTGNGERYFRPPVSSVTKDLWIRAEDANLNLAPFPNLSPAGITVPAFFPVYYKLNRLHQTWNLNKRNSYNEGCAEHETMYGRNYSMEVGKALLLLCLSSTTQAQKYELLRCLTQIGIDYTGVYEAGRVSSSGGLGSTSTGRKLTLAVAAVATGNARVLAASQAENWLPEQFQMVTLTQSLIDTYAYPQSLLGKAEWGSGRKGSDSELRPFWTKPTNPPPNPDYNFYRHTWMMGLFSHYVAMRLVPDLATAANWPQFMEYAERYYRVEAGLIPRPYEGNTYAANAFPGDGANKISSPECIFALQARQQFASYFPA